MTKQQAALEVTDAAEVAYERGDEIEGARLLRSILGSDWQGGARHVPGTVVDMARWIVLNKPQWLV